MFGYCAPWPLNMNATAGRPDGAGLREHAPRIGPPQRLDGILAIACRPRRAASPTRGGRPAGCEATSARFRSARASSAPASLAVAASSAASLRADRHSSCVARDGPDAGIARRLLEHDVGVGAADAERAHAGAPRGSVRPVPRLQPAAHAERAGVEVDLGVRPLEVQRRRHSRDARAPATVLISPATPAAASRWPTLLFTEPIAHSNRRAPSPERLGQRRDLDRIAQRRRRAVRLDVADVGGIDARRRVRERDHLRLAVDARRRVADLQRSVVVDRRPADHRADRCRRRRARRSAASAPRPPTPLPDDGPARARVEGAAVAVRRQDALLRRTGSRPSAAPTRTRRRPAPCRTRRSSRLWHARCTATSDVEQAVCTVTLGPRRFSL